MLFDFWQPGCGVAVISLGSFFQQGSCAQVGLVESLRTKKLGASSSGSRILAGPFGSICDVPVYPLTAGMSYPLPHTALGKLCRPLRESREPLNLGINDLQGEIKGTGPLHNEEKIGRRCCCKEEAENQTNMCEVG